VRSFCAVAAFIVLLGSSVASAQGAPDFYPARSIGFAGTRSLASSVDAIFLNPAALGQTQQYLLQLDYGNYSPSNNVLPGANGLVVSVLDSKTNPRFPTGLSYRWIQMTEDGQKVSASVYDFAIAANLFWNISLGLHVSYLTLPDNYQAVTGDVGLLIPIGPVNISGVGYNLLQVNDPDAPRGFDVGASVGDSKVYRFGFDFQRNWPYQTGVHLEPTNLFTFGGEVNIASIVSVRAGLLWNEFPSLEKLNPAIPQYVTGGIGFFYQFIGADFGYLHAFSSANVTVPAAENIWQISVKIATG
jgi:hypothetical protein